MVRSKKVKSQRKRGSKKKLTGADIVVPPVEHVDDESLMEESNAVAQVVKEVTSSQRRDSKESRRTVKSRSRERERSTHVEVSRRARRSERRPRSRSRHSNERRRPSEHRRRGEHSGSRHEFYEDDRAAWDDLRRLDPSNPRDRRRARSVGKTDPRRARSHRRNSPRRERVVSYSRNRGKSPRSPTLMDMIRERRSCQDESVVPRADALGGNRNRRSIREIMP